MQQCIHIDRVDDRGWGCIAWLIEHEHDDAEALFRELVAVGCDPDLADISGATPLHWAIIFFRYGIVHHLLKAGADPNSIKLDPSVSRAHQLQSPLLVSDAAPLLINRLLYYCREAV